MVVMALDHVRDFVSNARCEPTDTTMTWPALFFTRWVTHFCAPAFSFFAGTGAYLSLSRGMTEATLARFLATRGLFLIFFEAFVLRFVFLFNFLPVTFLITLWALGVGMLVLALLVKLRVRPWAMTVFGLVLVAGHDAFDFVDRLPLGGLAGAAWRVLHRGGLLPIGAPPPGSPLPGLVNLIVGYPVVPWPGVMALGFAFGALLAKERTERRRLAFGIGLAATAAFVVLRLGNVYGNPRPWAPQGSSAMTLASFLNCGKYPPSLDFLLMTLGPVLVAFAWCDRPPGAFGRALSVYGRVPMFYFVVHLALAHVLAVAVAAVQSGSLSGPLVRWATFSSPPFLVPPPPGFGVPLPGVWALWVGLVLALYVPCARYGAFKAKSRAAWTRYL